MNDYQQEQLQALRQVRHGLERLTVDQRARLHQRIEAYLVFRQRVDRFLEHHFQALCTQTCFHSRTSACCGKDAIITHFADTAINALRSTSSQLNRLEAALAGVNSGHRCIYLGTRGCLWAVRPLVCAMFLCDRALGEVLDRHPAAEATWTALRQEAKTFSWPDRPVLFDELEQVFWEMGHRSTLMHLHLSPGLLALKKKAGLI